MTKACSLLLWITLSCAALAQSAALGNNDTEYIKHILYPATALLYSQSEDGSMKMRCTTTAIDKNAKGYEFVSAAHCACEDNTDKTTVSPEKTFFFVSLDEQATREFMKAQPIGCGYRHRGDDFALFQVDTQRTFTTVPLGKDPDNMSQVVNIASPLGLGKQIFSGIVSAASLNRPVVSGDVNWTGAVLLQLFGVNGGSSGSSVVCLDQRAICAFLVGSIGETSMVAMPVSRLIKLRSELASGEYRYWKPDPYSKDR